MTTTDEAVLLDPMDKIQNFMRISRDVDTDTFSDFLKYRSNIAARKVIYKNFTDDEGNFRIEWMRDNDKKVLNTLSHHIMRYEKVFKETPIYDKVVQEFGDDLPDFLKDHPRDAMGRWTHTEIEEGWYQNSRGDLFHYDGVVWDDVPVERVQDLEFLG